MAWGLEAGKRVTPAHGPPGGRGVHPSCSDLFKGTEREPRLKAWCGQNREPGKGEVRSEKRMGKEDQAGLCDASEMDTTLGG